MLKNIIDKHQSYFKGKKEAFDIAKIMKEKQEVENEEAERKRLEEEQREKKASIENLKLKHSPFESPVNEKTGIPYVYNQTRLFKAGEPKYQDEPAKNVNSEEYLSFHGTFPFNKLGYDPSKLVRAGSVKLK